MQFPLTNNSNLTLDKNLANNDLYINFYIFIVYDNDLHI